MHLTEIVWHGTVQLDLPLSLTIFNQILELKNEGQTGTMIILPFWQLNKICEKNQQSHSIFKAPRLSEAGNTGTHPILVHEFQEGCCINALLHCATQAFANEPILLQLRIMAFPTDTNGSVNCSSLPSELTLELERHSHFF